MTDFKNKEEGPSLLKKTPGGDVLTNEELMPLTPLELKAEDIDDIKSSPYAFEKANETKRAWIAGLLQGEAYFTLDKRVHSKSNFPGYVPPPPTPIIKLAMVEQDLLEHYGELVEQNVVIENRKTSTGKTVYKVTVCQRDKVERLLKAILPHVVGEKTRSRIVEFLSICQEHRQWKEAGGRSNAASVAASIGHQKRKRKRQSKRQKEE
jgi:hypothetical protein